MTDLHIHIEKKTYPNRQQAIIENFQLTLKSREFVCLVGSNGCGKTTLLNIIAGLDDNYQGDIHVSRGQHATPKIGYVFQNPRLLPWRTVRENIELVLSEKHPSYEIDALLETMQLAQHQHDYPEHLAGGMNRRVAISRAFAVNPDVLLMDEPFVSLDAPTAKHVRELLIKLWQQRPHTVLFVTHDLREAITLADKLVFLAAKPLTVIADISVPIARDQRQNEAAVEEFRQYLLTERSDINALL